jgi:hypothetical protein
MGTKRPKPAPAKQLEDLLKAHALRRLEGDRPSSAPKRPKTKQASKRKKR